MTTYGDVEVEGLDGEDKAPAEAAAQKVREKLARPRKPTTLDLVPEDLHGLISRAALTTGLTEEELAREMVRTALGISKPTLKEVLLRVAKAAHAARAAAVEAALAGEGGAGE